MLTKPSSIDIATLVKEVNSESIFKPIFQRDYCWYRLKKNNPEEPSGKETLIATLFDSISKGWFIGCLTLIELHTREDYEYLNPTRFASMPPTSNSRNLHYMLLDGQQKSVSLHAPLTNSAILDATSGVYYKLCVLYNPTEKTFSQTHIVVNGYDSGSQDKVYLEKIKNMKKKTGCFNLYDLYSSKNDLNKFNDIIDEYFINKGLIPKRDANEWISMSRQCQDMVKNIENFTIPTVIITDKLPLKDLMEEFKRLNKNSVRMSNIELLNGKLSMAVSMKMNITQQFNNCRHCTLIKIAPNNMRRMILTLLTYELHDQRKLTEFENKFALDNHNCEDVIKVVEKITEPTNWNAYSTILNSIGIVNGSFLNESKYCFIYSIFVIGKNLGLADKELLRPIASLVLFTMIIMKREYDIINMFSKFMREIKLLVEENKDKDGNIILASNIQSTFIDIIDTYTLIDNWNEIENSVFDNGLYGVWMISKKYNHVRKLFDQTNTDSASDYFSGIIIDDIEEHHLYPKATLKAKDRKKKNIFNLCPIDWHDNRDIWKNPPHVYFPQMIKKMGKFDDKTVNKMLSDLDIPKEIMNDDYSADECCRDRKILMMASIHGFWEKIYSGEF